MCILLELMGSWFTRPLATEDLSEDSTQVVAASQSAVASQSASEACDSQLDSQPVNCYCRGPESGSMLACDDSECQIEWFHLKCLKMDETMIPKGKWYCPDCRKKEKYSRKKGKSKAKNLKQ